MNIDILGRKFAIGVLATNLVGIAAALLTVTGALGTLVGAPVAGTIAAVCLVIVALGNVNLAAAHSILGPAPVTASPLVK